MFFKSFRKEFNIKTNKYIHHNLPYTQIIKLINWTNSFSGLSVVLIRAFFVNAGIFYVFELVKDLL